MKEISIDATNISFTCQKCGKCCFLFKVFLTEEDIIEIEKLGYKREEFVDYYKKRRIIRRINNNCFFLEFKKRHLRCVKYISTDLFLSECTL